MPAHSMQPSRLVHVFVAFLARSASMLGMTQYYGAAMGNAAGESGQKHGYLAYMLRLWWDGAEEGEWRASLEDPHTGERTGFASPEALLAFLRHRIHPGRRDREQTERGEHTAPHGASQDGTTSLDAKV
jgi:hypothetical protein